MVELLNIDCLEYMKTQPDKSFDLAVVDPPYGIGADGGTGTSNKGVVKKYNQVWDSPPSQWYFSELKRVSMNQVIWGANYFENLSGGRIVWDKDNTGNFSDCEIAYQSFSIGIRKFRFRWNGMLQEDMKNKEKRIHPTQKPIALYNWIFTSYATKGQRVLDTHLGSGSIAISAFYHGLDFVGCEIDKEYYNNAFQRFGEVTRQGQLFEPPSPANNGLQPDQTSAEQISML